MPDTWLKFEFGTNSFNKSGFVKNVNTIYQIHTKNKIHSKNITFRATHYSPVHPEAPLCSSYVPRKFYQKLLFAAKT